MVLRPLKRGVEVLRSRSRGVEAVVVAVAAGAGPVAFGVVDTLRPTDPYQAFTRRFRTAHTPAEPQLAVQLQ